MEEELLSTLPDTLPLQGAAADSPEAPGVRAFLGPPGSLLRQLESLPVAWDRPPPLWIPRSVRQQVGTSLAALIAAAVPALSAPSHCLASREALLLCRNGPQLLLRAPTAAEDSRPDATASVSLAATVRRRLAVLRDEGWGPLVAEALEDYEAAVALRAGLGPRSADPADAPLSAAS